MIYALLDMNHPDVDCLAIAQAVHDHDAATIQHWVNKGVIVHVMQAKSLSGPFYCLWCRDVVSTSNARPPRGLYALAPWHFEHKSDGTCIGYVRSPLLQHAIGIENPSCHGCYILLGRETSPGRNRRDCQTIYDHRTYCHLALMMSPPCV